MLAAVPSVRRRPSRDARAMWNRAKRPFAWAAVSAAALLVVGTGVLAAVGWNVHDDPVLPQLLVRAGSNHFAILSADPRERIAENATRTTRTHWFTTSDFPFLEHEVLHEDVLPAQAPNSTFSIHASNGADVRVHVPDVERLRVAFVGDTGTGAHAEAILRQVALQHPDVVVHAGDVAYSERDEAGWDAWGRLVTQALPGIPFAYVTGNHDVQDGVSERQIESLRGPTAYYAFDLGPVHFVVLDANQVTPKQAQWLRDDLDAAQAARRPWIVPIEHQPWWSSGTVHGSDLEARAMFATEFAQHSVRLAVAGHEHNYERTHPIDGVTFVVTGGGGESLYPFSGAPPSWSASRSAEDEFVVVDFDPGTFSGRAVGPGGQVLDTFKG